MLLKISTVATAWAANTVRDIWSHVGQGWGWLHTLSMFANVTRPGTGHREVGFRQPPLWLAAAASATCLLVTGLSAPVRG